MKKLFGLFLILILSTSLLGGCFLYYDNPQTFGNYSYAFGIANCYASRYYSDCLEERIDVVFPDSVDDKKVVSIGGVFGRGVPDPFMIECSRDLTNETIEFDVHITLGKYVKDFKMPEQFCFLYTNKQEGGTYSYHSYNLTFECHEENKHFYTEDGALYRANGQKVEFGIAYQA